MANTTNITGDYWQFYLEGRGTKRLIKHDIAESDLVERMVTDGVPFRETIREACRKASVSLEHSNLKKAWVAAHADAIKAAGGDAEVAYAAYLHGCTDELAYALEQDVVDALSARLGADEEDEDEDEDEDEEPEEDEEDPEE